MKIIFGNPGSGKTKALLEMSARNRVPLLCESPARVARLLAKAEGYGIKIPTPITMEELDSSIKEVYIDDIQRVLEESLNVKVGVLTVNRDDTYCEVDLDKR